MVDRIAGLESMMTNLQSHEESQQEQILVAELVIQQVENSSDPDEFASAYPWNFSETGDFGWSIQGTDEVRANSLRVPRLVLQRKTSFHKSGREICWIATVDLGNHR